VAFLEDSFVAQTAPAENRRHKAAAQRVLAALLPEPGTSIKGAMRTKQDLQKQSGHARRPDQFSELLDLLDKKLRLVTPTDPVVKSSDGQPEQSADAEKRYQLTHDYLVPSLRDWLTSKKKETHRGRAELRLADRSESWTAKPENRHLPSLLEYLNIRLLTNSKTWTPIQRTMMQRAGRMHGLHLAIAAFLLVVLVVGGREIFGRIEAKALVEQLDAADIAEVPRIVDQLAGYRRWADPRLTQEDTHAAAGSKQKLHIAPGPAASGREQGGLPAGSATFRNADPIPRGARLFDPAQGRHHRAILERGARLEARDAGAFPSRMCLGNV
jgi:hypothetical protein